MSANARTYPPLIIAGCALLLGLAGCASDALPTSSLPTAPAAAPAAAPSTVATAVATYAAAPALDPDLTFMLTLIERDIGFGTKEAARNLGMSVCTAARGGGTTPMLLAAAQGTGYTQDQAWTIIVAAHSAYCPTLDIPGG